MPRQYTDRPTCKRCQIEKPIAEFRTYKTKKHSALPMARCRECERRESATLETPEMRAFRIANTKILNATPEAREARRILKQRIRATPEGKLAKRLEMVAYLQTPEGKATKRAAKAKRRARKLAAITESISGSMISAIFEAFRNLCAYCAKASATDLDHFVPLARGGSHTIANLVPACKPCNSSKHAQDPFVFLHARAAAPAPRPDLTSALSALLGL